MIDRLVFVSIEKINSSHSAAIAIIAIGLALMSEVVLTDPIS